MPEFESHQLIKQIPGVMVTDLNFVSDTSNIGPALSEGWTILDNGAFVQTWVWRGYIDLAGWSRQDLTNFIQTVDVQHSFPSHASSGITNLYEYDFVTSRRIRDEELLPPSIRCPGFLTVTPNTPPGQVDIMQLIYGEWVSQTVSVAEASSLVTVAADSFGGGSPIASDKLHITRLITVLGGGGAESFQVFPVNYVINAITTKEKDLVWMERLRRSYVLQEAV